jgi:hypothetical protein
MIVRIVGEGQYQLDDRHRDRLDTLVDRLAAAAEKGVEDEFAAVCQERLDTVRSLGTPVPDDTLVQSELVLPDQDVSPAQVAALFADDTLIPPVAG